MNLTLSADKQLVAGARKKANAPGKSFNEGDPRLSAKVRQIDGLPIANPFD